MPIEQRKKRQKNSLWKVTTSQTIDTKYLSDGIHLYVLDYSIVIWIPSRKDGSIWQKKEKIIKGEF